MSKLLPSKLFAAMYERIRKHSHENMYQLDSDGYAFIIKNCLSELKRLPSAPSIGNAKKVVDTNISILNDELDVLLLKEGYFTELFVKYQPLKEFKIKKSLQSISKDIEVTTGDLWEGMARSYIYAQRRFEGKNSDGQSTLFRTYLNRIIDNVLHDILKKYGAFLENTTSEDYSEIFDDFSIEDYKENEIIESLVHNFEMDFNRLDFIIPRHSHLKNCFRLILLAYYQIPIDKFGTIGAAYNQEMVERVLTTYKEKVDNQDKERIKQLYFIYERLETPKFKPSYFEKSFFREYRRIIFEQTFNVKIERFKSNTHNLALSLIIEKWYRNL